MTTLGYIALLIVVAALLLWMESACRWRAAHRRGRRYCPGPASGRWRSLDPRRWFRRPAPCGYDLHMASRDRLGAVICPECGTRHALSRATLLGSTARLRCARLGAVLMVIGLTGVFTRNHAGSLFLDCMPNAALLLAEATMGEGTPDDVVAALRERASSSELSQREMAWLAPGLVRDLRDDDVHWNADRAIDLLKRIGAPADEALHGALASPDVQQRHLAAMLLRRLHPDAPPSPALIRVTFEALRDMRGTDAQRVVSLSDAMDSLIAWRGGDMDCLRTGMESSDPQERMLVAALTGFASRVGLADRAVPILVAHLCDNHLEHDAVYALNALHGFGPEVVPLLEEHRGSVDAQGAACIEYLLAVFQARMEGRSTDSIRAPRLTVNLRFPLVDDPRNLEVPAY